MKLLHLSDLHLGKRVNEFSMIEDQKYILKEILRVVDDEKPDGVMIAGDVYDRSVPSAEAVGLLDDFLVSLASRGLEVFIISGNHDSAERLAFGGRLMEKGGIHIAPAYSGHVGAAKVSAGGAEADIYMLPFIKPQSVRRFFPDEEVETYTDAVRLAVSEMKIDPERTNILIAHQFVTGASRSESEEISVGGADNVDASVFEGFDYVALGHIHGPQNIGSGSSDDGAARIRYCGTPLKYSFSEAGHEKSVTVVELGASEGAGAGSGKCGITVRTVPLTPKRDMAELKGAYDEVTRRSFYEPDALNDKYVHITLTDEDDIPDAAAKLRTIYPYLMKLDYDNARTRHISEIDGADGADDKSPQELFAGFFEEQNGRPMSEEQAALVREMIEEIWEGEI